MATKIVRERILEGSHDEMCKPCLKREREKSARTSVDVSFNGDNKDVARSDMCGDCRKELGQLISGRIVDWPQHMIGNEVWRS